jgi:hypothetical protein
VNRGNTVFLNLTESRCTPSGYCHRKTGCARFLVKPEQGRPVADYSLQGITYIAWCAGWMDAAKHRDPLPGANGPRVHEAPGGIFRG